MHSEPEPEFTRACPFCHAIGVLTEVSMHAGARIIKYACSRCLKTWTIKNDPEANKLLTRNYRAPYIVPAKV